MINVKRSEEKKGITTMTTKPEMTIEQARRVIAGIREHRMLCCTSDDCPLADEDGECTDTSVHCEEVILEAARMVYSSEPTKTWVRPSAPMDRNRIAHDYIKSMYANPKCWDEPTEAILDVAFDLADQFIAMAEGGDGNETN